MFLTLMILALILIFVTPHVDKIATVVKDLPAGCLWAMAWMLNIPLLYAANWIAACHHGHWAVAPTIVIAVAYAVIVAICHFWWFFNTYIS